MFKLVVIEHKETKYKHETT